MIATETQAKLVHAIAQIRDAEATTGSLAAEQQHTINAIRLLHAATMLSMAQGNIKQALRQLQEVQP